MIRFYFQQAAYGPNYGYGNEQFTGNGPLDQQVNPGFVSPFTTEITKIMRL